MSSTTPKEIYKKVHNYFVFCAVAILRLLAFAACGDDDDNDDLQNGSNSSIVGEWMLASEKWWDKEDGEIIDSGEEIYNKLECILKFSSFI